WVFPGLREQLVALTRGYPLELYANHLFANAGDPAMGRQMPCHPTAREVNYVSMSSVIGTQISQAVGLAYALKLKHSPGVSLAFFGDGATSSNDFHAGMNFAGVFQLPVVFCCTNNQWAISVPVEKQSHVARLADKAAAYGIPGGRVDGTDFIQTFHRLRQALQAVREGSGPRMLEFVVFRMTPHSSSDDPTRYQKADWMERAKANDPLDRLERWMEFHTMLDPALKSHVAEATELEVKQAIAAAESVGPPDPGSLTSDVFASVAPRSDA
ncbi:MAG: thiamine pyrophosphate-dependent enzyme, partial [Thermoplasmata archaeon]|nr:thiamine pyrophosphate-dependent enzyme [Thermoplasmata archaeon]